MRTDFLSLVSMAISEQEAHQLLAVHRGGQFVLVEFARPRVDGRKVGLGMSSAGHQRRQVALRDHLFQTRFEAHLVEQVLGLAYRASL